MDEAGYDAALIEIDELMRIEDLSEDESRRLDELFDEAEAYDREHHPIRDAPPSDVLQVLMESNRLTAEDVAARSGIAATAIRDFLRGEIVPTLAQAVDLGKSFHVGPGVFWDREAMEDQIDCSDIPEITGPLVPERLRRDAEGRLLPRVQAAINVRDYIATLPEDEQLEIEREKERLNRGMRSTSE